jgi:hypothetical protein
VTAALPPAPPTEVAACENPKFEKAGSDGGSGRESGESTRESTNPVSLNHHISPTTVSRAGQSQLLTAFFVVGTAAKRRDLSQAAELLVLGTSLKANQLPVLISLAEVYQVTPLESVFVRDEAVAAPRAQASVVSLGCESSLAFEISTRAAACSPRSRNRESGSYILASV